MKNLISSLLRLAIVSLAAFPAFALAAPTAGSPYYTDTVNSYVHDQTSQVMSNLNNILCYMGAMAPDQMVNLTTNSGNYIALIDQNICETGHGGSGGQSSNTGPAYTSAVVHSSRASNSADMLVKVWVSPQPGNDIAVYGTATQAPSATLPYGIFRMDYCGGASCAMDKGFINATSSGLSFYSEGTHGGGNETTALLLNATGNTSGSGAISESNTWGGGLPAANNFLFAYNAGYFVRNDQTGSGDKCFDRSPATADESVWRYGLYDSTTGAHITRNSGFPIEYTDTGVTPNVTYNGYVGYYGLWMQGVTVSSGATVQQVTYGTSGPTKTAYTLLKTGGKLSKYTTAAKTLAQLDKVTFWYFVPANTNIPATGTVVMAGGTQGSQYELYWDNAATQFMVSGKQSVTTHNMESYTIPVAIDVSAAASNTAMVAATPWGLFAWSQMMGGQFGIKGSDFALLATNTSATPVLTQMQDIVYPSDYAAINTAGGLTCINDCPTAAQIGISDLVIPPAAQITPFINPGWSPTPLGALVTYTLDAATGNMVDPAPASAQVVSTATTGYNTNGVRSGRLVTAADLAALSLTKCGGSSCPSYNQWDVDLLPAGFIYYVWETGANQWNQLTLLMNGTTPVTFEPPLSVNFVVPTGAKYGSYQGATIRLEYGSFGDLWGIPNECVDVTTNGICDFAKPPSYQQQNFRWTSKFSIPTNATDGVVTVATAQGTVTQGTQYLVKALDKEIRLANVTCPAGLSTSGLSNAGLPVVADWVDPTSSAGTKPTFATVPAPQVIHGVKQY